MAQVDYTPNFTGAKTRTTRLVSSVSVGSDTYTMPSGTRNSYTDLTSTKTFTVEAGTTVTLGVAQSGSEASWMNAFVYVDMDNNGFTAGIAGDDYTPTGDLVSYSFYNQGYNDDENGHNSAGTSITGNPRSTLALPNWTVPADLAPGEYRIRFKYDWCNIDPAGDTEEYFKNTFTGHGGEIIDAKLIVEGRENYVYNTGSMNRNPGEERGLTTFTLTDGTNSLEVSDIQDANSRTAPVYADKSSVKFTTTQGATLSFSAFNYTGSWMHAYAYIDYNKDFKFNLTNNNNGEGEGEIVSYNYYEGKDITGETASQSDAMSSEHNGSKTLPAFTLPTDLAPGEYRMRIKIDWNNLDADYGASDIAANGGCQCDITLVVEESAANSEAKAELKAAIKEFDDFLASISVGNCITQYSSSIDSPGERIEDIRGFYNAIDSKTSIESIEEQTANVLAIKESYTENVLEDGKFYHIRSVAYENGYVYASLGDEKPTDDREERNGILWKAAETPSNTAIWKCEIINGEIYFKNIYTASYMNRLESQSPGVLSETEKAPITLTALGDGQVNFLVDGQPAHAQNSDGYHNFVPWVGGKNTPSAWYVEEATAGVQPHVLTVGAAGYATLMLGYNTTIPDIEGEDCGVFVATVEGEYAVLNEIEEVLPANTAVIVKATPGNYTFEYTTKTATVENNALRGTLYDKYITEDAYVLGYINVAEEGQPEKKEVGFYTATTTGQAEGTFLNNANKVYLPKTAGMNAASYSFRFGEGTTGISEVKGENGEVKTIYDLTGRRIEAITAPGIYIVGGKKVLVK